MEMTYQLSETDMNQLQILKEQIFLYYNEEDALKMIKIIDRALLNGWMNKDDIYELLEILPRTIPFTKEKTQTKPDNQNTNWNEYTNERRARYNREMKRLHQILSNWIFVQSAVCRKNMDSIKKSKENFINI